MCDCLSIIYSTAHIFYARMIEDGVGVVFLKINKLIGFIGFNNLVLWLTGNLSFEEALFYFEILYS